MADEKAAHDKALDLFVYAPVGVALYVRDMLPTMMNIFVARGKREVQSHLPGTTAGPVPTPPPAPPAPSPAEVRRRVEEGIGFARVAAESGVGVAKGVAGGGIDLAKGLAGSALSGIGAMRPPAPPGAPATPTPPAPPSPPTVSVPRAPDAPASDAGGPGPAAPAPPPPAVGTLPIPDYDELSASQVVERLDGLDRDALDSIRRYEAAHRGRNTILGKIAQLT